MIAIMKKAFVKFQWGSSFDTKLLNDAVVSLPVTEINEPDRNYMQEHIAELEQERITELEQERITELEQYLIATGLNDYELTEEDKQILTTKLTDGGGHHKVRNLEVVVGKKQKSSNSMSCSIRKLEM